MKNKKYVLVFGLLIFVITIILVLIFFVIILGKSDEVIDDGSILDQGIIQKIDYSNYWEYLKSEDEEKVIEIKQEYDLDDNTNLQVNNYLRICGGLSAIGYYLETETGKELRNNNELRNFLGKVSSPEEAMAMVYANFCYFDSSFENEKQFVNKVDDGYVVTLFYMNFFGCGHHPNIKVSYKIKFTGEIEKINEKRLNQGEEYCGD